VKQQPDPHQVSLLPPEAASLLHLVRENLRLLAELSARYEVGHLAPSLDRQVTVHNPSDIANYLGPELADLAQEQVRAVLVDNRNRVMATVLVYQGGMNTAVVRMADCFREAVRAGAIALVLVHNHPSGDPSASMEDVKVTYEAAKAGNLLGIEVLDHIIIGRPGYVSMREMGLFDPAKVPQFVWPAEPPVHSTASQEEDAHGDARTAA
jgi:DNA repair protein RadC